MDEKRKQNSDKKKLFLVLGILVAVAILLGVIALVKLKKDDDTPVTKLPSNNTEVENKIEALTTYELLNDPLAKGYIGEGVNTSSFPKDAVWKRLQASKIPLKIGESYIETFDREYFDTRLRAQTMGNGVTAELSSKDSLRAGTGNSLIIDSEIGIYTGVYLKGMRFSANGIYQVEFDYKIIKESDDFFFQFRADSDGKSGVRTGDKFVTIKGQTGSTGSIRWVAQLDNFQDYGIMIFPRNKAGKIAIDNIKITRLAENYNELAVGNTIKEDFDGTMYFELDKELVPNSGFITGDKAIEGRSLYIESDKEYQCIYLKGFNFISGEKYRIKFDYVINDPTSNFYVQMISKSGEFKQFYSFGDGTVATKELRSFDRIFEIGGDEKEYLLQIFPGAGNEKSGITIDNIEVTRMSSEWSVFEEKAPTKKKAVIENFENGLYKGQLLVSQHNTGLYNIVKDKSHVLQISMPDKFSGIEFVDGLKLTNGQKYKVSFDYKVVKNPDLGAFYTQFTGGVDYGQLIDLTEGKTGSYETVITAGNANDEEVVLQMFGNQSDMVINIDNLKIIVADEASIPKDIELNVGEKYVNDFDDNNRLVLDINNVPNSTIESNSNTIDGNSFILNSTGEYKSVYIKGITLDGKGIYRVSFDYKVMERKDIFYFQFISQSGTYTNPMSFGDETVPLDSVRTFDQIFVLNTEEEVLMQMFPGATKGDNSVIIDNFTIERLDPDSSVFVQKTVTEDSAVTENFENGLYGGSITPNQQGTGTFSIVDGFDGKGLEITVPDAFAGVQFKNGVKFESGEKYSVSFEYKVTENPNNAAFYVQIGGVDYEEVSVPAGTTGNVKTTLTAGSANGNPEVLQIFANQPGLKLLIDNLRIEVAEEIPVHKDIELNVGEKYTNDFDENNDLILDTSNVPNSSVESNSDTIDDNSFVLNSDGEYKGVYIKGITLDSKGIYRVSFDYKVMERQDLFYFQFISQSGTYTNAMSFGDGAVPLGSTRTFDQIFVLDADEEMLMQMFPGSTKGSNSVIVDNFTIERLDPESPVFKQKAVTEDNAVTEDFENGLYKGSITPNQHGTGTFSIVDGLNGKGLGIVVPDAFSGVQFARSLNVTNGEKYKVSFDYEVVKNPKLGAFYVQFTGGVDFGQMVDLTEGKTGGYEAVITAGVAGGAPVVLQLFGNQPDMVMNIDNLKIEVVPKELYLNIGSKYVNDFDDNNRLRLDMSLIPDAVIENNSDTIDGKSFILNSNGEYQGVNIQGIDFEGKGIYRIRFDYKVMERQDLFYFQFISGTGAYVNYMQFGDAAVSLNSTRTFDQIFVLDTEEEVHMQIFSGPASGNVSLIIDNFTIERLNPEVPVFVQKEVTETSPVTEDFENGFYAGSITPNQQGTGTFSIVDGLDGKCLEVVVPDAFAGVQFKNGVSFKSGDKYNVFFDYKVIENPNNAAFYVQIGGVNYKEVSEAEGTVMTTLTAGSAGGNPEVLQIFASNAGLKMLIDNIRIEKFVEPSTPLDEKFDEVPYYNWTPNSSGDIVNLTSDTDKLPSNGAGNSLYVNCVNQYGGVVMTPLYEALRSGQKYDISFDIKVLNVPEGVVLYIQSGGGNFISVPIVSGMDEKVEVTLAPQTEFIQLFTSIAGVEFTIDNWSMKLHVATEVYEDFEDFNALGITLIPTDAEFSESNNVPTGGSGNSLYMKCLAQYGKLTVEKKGAFVVGEKYIIKMKYKTIANPNNSILYIQFPYSGINQVLDPNINPEGTCEVQLVAESTDSIWLMSSAPGLELVIDDLSIERVTSGVFYSNFDTADNFIANPNNEATITSCFNPNLRPNGATNNSLMVTSQSAYGGVILVPKNFTMEAGKDYRLSFRYKIIENLSAGPLYIKLGNGGGEAQLNSEAGHSELVNITLKAAENLIQIFGGPVSGIKFTIDDFVIEPVN